MQSGFASALLSISVLGAFLLAGGGVWLIVKGRDGRKGALMIVCALVLLGNILVWTV